MHLSAALDMSGNEAILAVANLDTNSILFETHKTIKGRDGASLPGWIKNTLEHYELTISEIKEWTVGTGPGSFTGLRLTASLISGFGFENPEIRVRGLPTALALAADISSKPDDKILILYPGRRNDVLLFKIINKDGELVPDKENEVLTENDISESVLSDFDLFIGLKKDKAALSAIIPERISPKIYFSENIPITNLIFQHRNHWNPASVTDLQYIRPATYAKPNPKIP